MRFVPVMTEAQQVVLSLHRLRAQLMKTRIMQTNEVRRLLYEFGIVLPEGHAALLNALPDAMCDAKARLPAMLMDSLDEQLRRLQQLQADIGLIERRLSQQMREMPACKAVAEIPGVGLLRATAVVASMGAPTAFKGRTGMCGVGGTGSAPDRHRRADKAAWHQQAWRCLPANAADARRARRRDQIQGWPDMAMADSFVAAPTVQRGSRCGGQQAGARRLGRSCLDEIEKTTALKESKRPRL